MENGDNVLTSFIAVSCTLVACRTRATSEPDRTALTLATLTPLREHYATIAALLMEVPSNCDAITEFLDEPYCYLIRVLTPSAIFAAVSTEPACVEQFDEAVQFIECAMQLMINLLSSGFPEMISIFEVIFGAFVPDPLVDSPGSRSQRNTRGLFAASFRTFTVSTATEYVRSGVPPWICTPLRAHFIHFFGNHGGFTAILGLIKSKQSYVSCAILLDLLRLFASLKDILHDDFKNMFGPALARVLFAFFEGRDPSDIKSFTINNIATIVDHIQHLIPVTANPPARVSIETFILSLLLDWLDSPFLDKKIVALNEIVGIVSQATAKMRTQVGIDPLRSAYKLLKIRSEAKDNSSQTVKSVFSVLWLTPLYICEWVLKNSVVDKIFAGHDELIKRSTPLLVLLQQQQKLEHSHLQMLWSLTSSAAHHESTHNIALVVLYELSFCLNLEQLSYLSKILELTPMAAYTPHFLALVEQETVHAWKEYNQPRDLEEGEDELDDWFGLRVIWNAIFSKENPCLSETYDVLLRLLSSTHGESFRPSLLDDCIANIHGNTDVASSCDALQRILLLYPLGTLWASVTSATTRQGVIDSLELICQEEYALLDRIIEILSDSLEDAVLAVSVQNVVIFFIRNSSPACQKSQLERLWSYIVECASSSPQKEDMLYKWLVDTMKILQASSELQSSLFSAATFRGFFVDILLVHIHGASARPRAFALVDYSFFAVDESGWVSVAGKPHTKIEAPEVKLVLEFFISAALENPFEDVAQRAREILSQSFSSSTPECMMPVLKQCLSKCESTRHLSLLCSILALRTNIIPKLRAPATLKLIIVPDNMFAIDEFELIVHSSVTVVMLRSLLLSRLSEEGIPISVEDMVLTTKTSCRPLSDDNSTMFNLGIVDGEIIQLSRVVCCLSRFALSPSDPSFQNIVLKHVNLGTTAIAEIAEASRSAFLEQSHQRFISRLNDTLLPLFSEFDSMERLFTQPNQHAWDALSLLPLHHPTLEMIKALDAPIEQIFPANNHLKLRYAFDIATEYSSSPQGESTWSSKFVSRNGLVFLARLLFLPDFLPNDAVTASVFRCASNIISSSPGKNQSTSIPLSEVILSDDFFGAAVQLVAAAFVRSFPHEHLNDNLQLPVFSIAVASVTDELAIEAVRFIGVVASVIPNIRSFLLARSGILPWLSFVTVRLPSRNARHECCGAIMALGFEDVDKYFLPIIQGAIFGDDEEADGSSTFKSIPCCESESEPGCVDALLRLISSTTPSNIERTWVFLAEWILDSDLDANLEVWRSNHELLIIRTMRCIIGSTSCSFLEEKQRIKFCSKLLSDRIFALPNIPRRPKSNFRLVPNELMQLIIDICQVSSPTLSTCLAKLLCDLPELSSAQPPSYGFGYHPAQMQRVPDTPVGLKNQGSTCYMNSLIQLLFATNSFREGVLAEQCCDSSSLLFQIQVLFCHLMASHRKWHDCLGFCQSIRDLNGEPFVLQEQQDVHEFANHLFDKLVSTSTEPESSRKKLWGFVGVLVNQMISGECPHRSERSESFFMVSLTVVNKSDLLSALSLFVEGEQLDGDNKWKCEHCDKKVPAVKRVCFKASALPNHLIFHLKRFEYDFDLLQKIKINSRFEFPMEFSMAPFLDNEFDRAEDEGSDCDRLYMYRLVGILVHTGVADAGHYFAFGVQSGGSWFQFNDTSVSPFDLSEIPDQCFGGNSMLPSAYLLFYERVHKVLGEHSTSVVTRNNGRYASLMELPVISVDCFAEVTTSNIAFCRDQQLFDSRFMNFAWYIIQYSWPQLHFHDERDNVSVESESACISLATNYCLQVILRSDDPLSFPYWLWLIQQMLKNSPSACAWFIEKMSHPLWIEMFFVTCPAHAARLAILDLILCAFRNSPDYIDAKNFFDAILSRVSPQCEELLLLIKGISYLERYCESLLASDAVVVMKNIVIDSSSSSAGHWIDHVAVILERLCDFTINADKDPSRLEPLLCDALWVFALAPRPTRETTIGAAFPFVAGSLCRIFGEGIAVKFKERAFASMRNSGKFYMLHLDVLSQIASAGFAHSVLFEMIQTMNLCLDQRRVNAILLSDCMTWLLNEAHTNPHVALWLRSNDAVWKKICAKATKYI